MNRGAAAAIWPTEVPTRVLQQGPAAEDVDRLQAAADPEHGQAPIARR